MPDSMLDAKLARRLSITLLVFALYTIGRFGIDQIRPPGMIPNDYQTFHKCAVRLAHGEQIYNPDDPSPFKYSPTFMFAYASTIDHLPLDYAWYAYCALSIIGFAWATRWLWLTCLGAMSGRRLTLLLAIFGVFGWHGYIEHFSYGQADMYVYALFLMAVAAKTDLGAAALMSTLLMIKPPAAFFLAYFLIARRWRVLAFTAGLTPALLLLPALFWGWNRLVVLFGGWQHVVALQTLDLMTGNLNQSVAASLARLLGRLDLFKPFTTVTVALGGLSALFVAARHPLPREASPTRQGRAAVGLLLLYAVITPLSWRWATFIWLPLGVVLADRAFRDETAAAGRGFFTTGRALLVAFALNGILLQTVVAHTLGIAEIDDLSRCGLYTLGNLLLLAVFLSQSAQAVRSRAP